jgi:hypothetical protein
VSPLTNAERQQRYRRKLKAARDATLRISLRQALTEMYQRYLDEGITIPHPDRDGDASLEDLDYVAEIEAAEIHRVLIEAIWTVVGADMGEHPQDYPELAPPMDLIEQALGVTSEIVERQKARREACNRARRNRRRVT